jgi:hypothetical protein
LPIVANNRVDADEMTVRHADATVGIFLFGKISLRTDTSVAVVNLPLPDDHDGASIQRMREPVVV